MAETKLKDQAVNTTIAQILAGGNYKVVSGWGYLASNGTKNISGTLSFGATFTNPPMVLIVPIGTSGTTPTSPSSFAGANNDVTNYVVYSVYGIGVSSATVQAFVSSAQAAGTNFGYAWIAIGT